MPQKFIHVILSGGSGSRLWPLSRLNYPKQYLPFFAAKPLFESTLNLFDDLAISSPRLISKYVLTNEAHKWLILKIIKNEKLIPTLIFLEPKNRNTAPALSLAAFHSIKTGDDPVLVVTPSDHELRNNEKFKSSLIKAINAAADGSIVLLGAKAESPETGFGYIEHAKLPNKDESYNVLNFHEKPTAYKAKKYLSKDNCLWNCGIFVLKSSTWLHSLKLFNSNIYKSVYKSYSYGIFEENFINPKISHYSAAANLSIDKAIIEKLVNSNIQLKVISINTEWKDIGSWSSIWNSKKKDSFGNVSFGDVFSRNTQNSIIYSSHRLIATSGIKNLAIIETPDAILVSNLNNSQDIKVIVENLAQKKRPESYWHKKVFRSWGWYNLIDQGNGFKVKRIFVNPKSSLSLQKHAKRAEHWVVVSGKALVTSGNKSFELSRNESTYIPVGVIHKLANPHFEFLEIIEVQTGDYLEEDDIIRYE